MTEANGSRDAIAALWRRVGRSGFLDLSAAMGLTMALGFVQNLVLARTDAEKSLETLRGDAITVIEAAEGAYWDVVASREASLALPPPPGPVDHAIVGIVDAVEEWRR